MRWSFSLPLRQHQSFELNRMRSPRSKIHLLPRASELIHSSDRPLRVSDTRSFRIHSSVPAQNPPGENTGVERGTELWPAWKGDYRSSRNRSRTLQVISKPSLTATAVSWKRTWWLCAMISGRTPGGAGYPLHCVRVGPVRLGIRVRGC